MNIKRLSEYVAELLLRTPRLKFVCMAPKSRKGPWVLAKLITGDDLPRGPFVRFTVVDPRTRKVIGSSPYFWRPFGVAYDQGPWEMGKRTMTILRREYEKFKDWPAMYAREGLPMPYVIDMRLRVLGSFLREYDDKSA